jgi:hypothetical protein
MNRKVKEVYVPPLIELRQVIMNEWVAVPTSVIIANGSITQENNWGTETPTDATTEENVLVDF